MYKDFRKALKNFKQQKGQSSFNILGQVIEMTVCILLLLWVQDKLSFDRFHIKGESTYRIIQEGLSHYNEEYGNQTIPYALAPILEDTSHECNKNNESYYRYNNKSKKNNFSNNRLLQDIPALKSIISIASHKGGDLVDYDDPLDVVVTSKVTSISRSSSDQNIFVTYSFLKQEIYEKSWFPEGSDKILTKLLHSHEQGGLYA